MSNTGRDTGIVSGMGATIIKEYAMGMMDALLRQGVFPYYGFKTIQPMKTI